VLRMMCLDRRIEQRSELEIRDRHLEAPSQCEPRENPMDVQLRESAQENAPRLLADQLRNPCHPGCRLNRLKSLSPGTSRISQFYSLTLRARQWY
jgi:hypothetical protein